MENFASHLERDRERVDIGDDQAGLSGLVHISFHGAYTESLPFYQFVVCVHSRQVAAMNADGDWDNRVFIPCDPKFYDRAKTKRTDALDGPIEH